MGGKQVTLSSIPVFVVYVLVTWVTSRAIRKAVTKGIRARGLKDEGTLAFAERLTHYGVMVVGVAVALDNLGISLSALFAAGAVFGVAIGSDMSRVMQVLAEAMEELPWKLGSHEPTVFLTEFGSSSVNFRVSVWMQDPWTSPRARSEMNNAIWDALQKADITIAFPQIDVHFDGPVTESLAHLPRAS